MLHGHNMRMVFGSKKIATMALAGTEFEPVLKLHVGRTCYLCSKDLQVPKLLKFAKKMNTYILLGKLTICLPLQLHKYYNLIIVSGGVVQGRLLTKSQLLWVATLPNIDTLRAELCSILSSPSSQLSQTLTYQQQSLSRSLEQHVNQENQVSVKEDDS